MDRLFDTKMFKKTAGATKQAVLEKMGKAHSTQTTETSEQLQQLAVGIKAKKVSVRESVLSSCVLASGWQSASFSAAELAFARNASP